MQRVTPSLLFLSVALTWVVTSLCWAESPSPPLDARELLKRGTVEAGAAVGYWQAVSAPFHALQVFLEPVFAQFTQPVSAQLAGGSVLFKYNLVSFGRWIPFWDAGLGISWTNLVHPRIPEESEPMNFLIQTGPGLQYLLSPRLSVMIGVRFHHISNADIGERNSGLNAVLPYVGLSWFFQK